MLDGLVSGGVALLAGAAPDLAARIGLAMTLLQLGIGTANDIVDAPRDVGQKAGKPIPAGLVSARSATGVALGLFGAGLGLALTVSGATTALAVVVIGIGLVYDLRLKGTAWSWVPFAVGIPILPVFGWIGATGTLPPPFAILLPAACAAGAALAIGNALVDIERDRAAGASSIAVALGRGRSGWVLVAILTGVGSAAIVSAMVAQRPIGALAALGLVSIVLVAASRASASPTASAARRERMWQVEAVGLAILATIWVGVMVSAGFTT